MIELPTNGISMEEMMALTTPDDPAGVEFELTNNTEQEIKFEDPADPDNLISAAYFILDNEDIAGGVYWSFQSGGTASAGFDRKFSRRGCEVRTRERHDRIYVRNKVPGQTGLIYLTLAK